MSRRASLFARQNPGRRRVRFPDEVVFDESVKENDADAVVSMLRRASVDIDVNRINSAGLTALHQAALDGNLPVVRILTRFGADLNCRDTDSWTPLHAACSMGHHHVARYLLESGADPTLLTEDGERPLDLVDPSDLATVAVMLQPPLVGHSAEEEEEEEEDDEDDNSDHSDDHVDNG
ncbi:protein phosphatase 1 regulatory subunit 27-like [Amphibalanus amphitrite]|uniref:protein phosphatase 1 regulatory subunit 27-like n=1 Tax=Amphibalanus amphitrite TaxID=1232801 RepID=UPI001C8FBC9B|nr:protein phosphatase 1 regulatory subunit 27-like [Amphibalanus amphitrite]XP_043202067.1 protein phosphatase 1 regulatory subunit 27-like [Amphibalanus amphitrite]